MSGFAAHSDASLSWWPRDALSNAHPSLTENNPDSPRYDYLGDGHLDCRLNSGWHRLPWRSAAARLL